MSGNYPPGVSGNEPQIAGYDEAVMTMTCSEVGLCLYPKTLVDDLLAAFQLAALPTDVLELGLHAFDLAGGESQLALQRGKLDLVALDALAAGFDLFLKLRKLGFEVGDPLAGGGFGLGQSGDFGFQVADFVLELQHRDIALAGITAVDHAFRA